MSSGGEDDRSSALLSAFQNGDISSGISDGENSSGIPVKHGDESTTNINNEGLIVGCNGPLDNVNVRICTLIKGAPANDPRILEPTHIETNEGGKLKRNSFACMSCHSLKQKCVPSDTNDIYRKPCIRCLKNNKLCKFDLSKRTRKRRRRESPISSPSSVSPKIEFHEGRESKKEHSPTSPSTKSLDSHDSYPNSRINRHYRPHGVTTSNSILRNSQHPISDLWTQQSNVTIPIGASTNFDSKSVDNPSMIGPPASTTYSTAYACGYSGGYPNGFPLIYNPNGTQALAVPNSSFGTQNIGMIPENVTSTISHRNPMAESSKNDTDISSAVTRTNPDNAPKIANNKIITGNNNDTNGSGGSAMDTNGAITNPNLVPHNINSKGETLNKEDTFSHKNHHSLKKQLHDLLAYHKSKLGEMSSILNSLAREWDKTIQENISTASVTDPISLGIIFQDEAENRFEVFMWSIIHESNMPFVNISPGTTAAQLRREKPILFSTIMSCSSIMMTPKSASRETNMKLDSFLLSLITDQIFKVNNKSIELIESLLTLCLWYNFPEWANKTRYHIFNYACVCLTKELGPTITNRTFGMCVEDYSITQRSLTSPLEAYENGPRLILLVYISSLNISIFLRQSIKARWAPATEQACLAVCEKLASGDDNVHQDDQTLVVFARLNHILEKIHVNLHEHSELDDDNDDDNEFTQKHIDLLITKFQHDLNALYKEIPVNRQRVFAYFYSVQAYLYQYIIGSYIESMPTKFGMGPLPSKISDAFLKCYEYCALTLKEFVKLAPRVVGALPLFHSSRIVYTVGTLLLKLRYSTIALPAFQQFQRFTEEALILVTKVSKLLEETSRIFVSNRFLYKLQYVVALFVQSFTNKVRAFTNSQEKKNTKRSTISNEAEFVENLQPMQPEAIQGHIQNLSQSPNNMILDNSYPTTDTISPTQANDPRNLEHTLKFQITSPYNKVGPNITETQPPSVASSENINDCMADIDSIVWGFNALNDEFWSDIFLNDL